MCRMQQHLLSDSFAFFKCEKEESKALSVPEPSEPGLLQTFQPHTHTWAWCSHPKPGGDISFPGTSEESTTGD